MRRALLAAFVAVLVIAGAQEWRVSAQEIGTFDVSVSLVPRVASLGERVQLVVTVRHGQDLLISVDEPVRASDIDLLLVEPEELVFDDPATGGVAGMATTTFRFTIAGFQLGELRPGEIEVSWLGADGSSGSRTVLSPPLPIRSVRSAGDTELRPLRPQATTGTPPVWWQRTELPIAIALIAVAVGAVVFWFRRRPRAEPLIFIEEAESLEGQARARLDALQSAALRDRDGYRKFYGELSIVVRSYLATRFEFNATAFTTGELRERFDDAGIGRWQARLVDSLLERCDAAVYARAQPDPASADHDLTVAYEIIELSRPRRTDVVEAVSA